VSGSGIDYTHAFSVVSSEKMFSFGGARDCQQIDISKHVLSLLGHLMTASASSLPLNWQFHNFREMQAITRLTKGPRVRKSFRELEKEHYAALKAKKEGSEAASGSELETLILAFRAIFKKDVTEFNSFFTIAGYHGEPFRGAGWGNAQWWGGKQSLVRSQL
jgi:hypothetical protein